MMFGIILLLSGVVMRSVLGRQPLVVSQGISPMTSAQTMYEAETAVGSPTLLLWDKIAPASARIDGWKLRSTASLPTAWWLNEAVLTIVVYGSQIGATTQTGFRSPLLHRVFYQAFGAAIGRPSRYLNATRFTVSLSMRGLGVMARHIVALLRRLIFHMNECQF